MVKLKSGVIIEGTDGEVTIVDEHGNGIRLDLEDCRQLAGVISSMWGLRRYNSLDALIEETKRRAND